MILIIDNYDSFTYNLYQFLGEINPDIKVVRNDVMTIEQIRQLKPTHIVLSPGPGRPEDAGICVKLIKELSGKIPILGICLGHQAISLAFGGDVVYSPQIVHGKASEVRNYRIGLLSELPYEFMAGRYHSLCVQAETIPDCLQVHASSKDGVIMAMGHTKYPTYGLQFHPESVLTPLGKDILKKFMELEVA